MSLDRVSAGDLRTARLLLRRWRPADRPAFARLNADVRVMEHFPSVLTRDESDALVDLIDLHFERYGYGLWAVEIPGAAGMRSKGRVMEKIGMTRDPADDFDHPSPLAGSRRHVLYRIGSRSATHVSEHQNPR